MKSQASSVSLGSINRAIRALCPVIEERINSRSHSEWREIDLRKELVGCVLGSQVRHEMAVAATENLEASGLMADRWWCNSLDDGFGTMVFEVLSGNCVGLKHSGGYRFPSARAQQLEKARNSLVRIPLKDRVLSGKSPFEIRKQLISDIPGLGPKQASMFLRNIGMSYDLAILDVHVLRFLKIQALLPS